MLQRNQEVTFSQISCQCYSWLQSSREVQLQECRLFNQVANAGITKTLVATASKISECASSQLLQGFTQFLHLQISLRVTSTSMGLKNWGMIHQLCQERAMKYGTLKCQCMNDSLQNYTGQNSRHNLAGLRYHKSGLLWQTMLSKFWFYEKT